MSMAVGNNESETDPPTAVAAVSAAPKAPTGSSRRSPRSPKTARENLRSPVKSPKSSARLAVAETAPSSAADDAFFNDKFLEEAEFAMLIFAAIIYAFFICLYNFCFKIYMIIQKLIQFVQMCREHPVIFRQTCRIIYNGYGEWWTVCGVIRFMFEAPPPNVYVEQSLSDAPTEGGWDFSWMSMRSSSNTSSAETASTDKVKTK